MKNLQNLGQVLSKTEQQIINGGCRTTVSNLTALECEDLNGVFLANTGQCLVPGCDPGPIS